MEICSGGSNQPPFISSEYKVVKYKARKRRLIRESQLKILPRDLNHAKENQECYYFCCSDPDYVGESL
jgi:hypothetical protein